MAAVAAVTAGMLSGCGESGSSDDVGSSLSKLSESMDKLEHAKKSYDDLKRKKADVDAAAEDLKQSLAGAKAELSDVWEKGKADIKKSVSEALSETDKEELKQSLDDLKNAANALKNL